MATCADYSVWIQLYIDDELEGSDKEELLSHLESCGHCRDEMEELKSFSAKIRHARPGTTAPPSLRQRILEQAVQEQQKKVAETVIPQRIKAPSKQSIARSSWFPAAVAAMLCLVIGGTLLLPHFHRRANARSFVDSAVTAHRGLMNASLALDVRSDSPNVVSAWFASRVHFPFRMPNAGIASNDNARYALAGGRLTTFEGEPAALLSFQMPEMPNDTISLLIASGKKAEANGGKVTYSSGIKFHSMDQDDLHIVTWENQQLVYALIFSNKVASMSNKRSCSSCHEGAAPSSSTTALLGNFQSRLQ
jgi:anti-sigma factor RsiW